MSSSPGDWVDERLLLARACAAGGVACRGRLTPVGQDLIEAVLGTSAAAADDAVAADA